MSRGTDVIDFIEGACVVPEGSKMGQLFKLLDFQKKFILDVYDNPAGTEMGILSIGRKNGKTALIACLVIAHLVGPEAVENSQIVSGALSRDQAALVYNLAEKIIDKSPLLRGKIKTVPSKKMLKGLVMNTEFTALAAEGKTAHGLSPILAILDEAGQVTGPRNEFFDAITTSQGAHDNPLLLVISTQAPSDADLLSIWIDDALAGEDPSIVCHLHAAHEDCDLMDEKEWAKANPAMGVFRSKRDVEKQALKAERMPTSEAVFRVLILNQRVNMDTPFVTRSVWNGCNAEPMEFLGDVYGGLDLSATTDLTSLILVNRQDGDLSVESHFWMPEDNVVEASKRDRAPYDLWVKQGLIHTTPGKVIDYDFVARDIGDIMARFPYHTIAFDRWRMDRLISSLDRAGLDLNLEPFGQGFVSMSPALDALEQELLNKTLRHGGSPVLSMCAANAVVVMDPAGNRKLDKSKAIGRIDGMVALTMAAGTEATVSEENPPTPWDTDPEFSLTGTG